MILLPIAVAVLAFYLRIKPRLLQKDFGIDSWYFLLYAEEFRRTRRIPVKLPYFMLDLEDQWYPPGLAIFLSFFPQRFIEKFNFAISALIDVLQVLLLYLISYLLSKSHSVSFFSALLYASSPILITQNSNLNSRSLGALIFTSALLSLYAFISTSNYFYLFLTIILGACLLHTHKLATQQMVFLILAFICSGFINFAVLAGIYLTAIFFSGGFYLKIFKGHIAILKFWKKNIFNLYAHQIYRSPIYRNKEKEQTKRGCQGVASNKIWYFLAKLQFLFAIILVIYSYFRNRPYFVLSDYFFVTWFIVNCITIILTTYIKPLKFLGEGYRYYMYGIFPSSYLISRFGSGSGYNPSLVFIFIILAINMALIVKIHNDQKKNILACLDADLKEMGAHIKELPKDNIMCFPAVYCEFIAYFCRKKTLWGGHGYCYDKLQDFFPVLLKPVEYFIEAFKISYCLINTAYVSLDDLFLKINFKIIKQVGKYYLIEFLG